MFFLLFGSSGAGRTFVEQAADELVDWVAAERELLRAGTHPLRRLPGSDPLS